MIQFYRKRNGMERINDVTAPSLNDLFTNSEGYLFKIKEAIGSLENVFYTLNDSKEGDREFSRFTHLAFDIDGADVTRWEEYRQAVNDVTGAANENVTVVMSGHGLHLLIELTPGQQWTDVSLFPKKKLQYRAVCMKVEDLLAANTHPLPGKVDSSIFDRARILRVPGTLNAKPGKEVVESELLSLGLTPLDVSLELLSGITIEEGGKSATSSQTKKEKNRHSIEWHGANDDEAIIAGCAAIRKCASNPSQVDEPLWYAIDSVVGRLKGGRSLLHEWAKPLGHPKDAVDAKITQALEASGPRTCESIEGLWDGCQACPNYKKVTSPIQIKGPSFIATESTGFHMISVSATGALIKRPDYQDLMRFFKKSHEYISLQESRRTKLWNGTFYEEISDTQLESFAQDHFNPFADTAMVSEFRHLLQRTNVKSVAWFQESTMRKLNVANGVLNLANLTLDKKHTPDNGFTYVLPFGYDPIAPPPALFNKFMSDITCGDKELERALLEFIALALTNADPVLNEKILVLTGEGSNGKTTLLRILRALFGKTVVAFRAAELLSEFHRSRLEGAKVCVMEEMPSFKDNELWELLKGLSSGDQISVSKKFKDGYEIENRAKFIVTCNRLPGGTDPTHGYFRRLLIVPFKAQFEGEAKDVRLAEKIITGELPGVLNRVLEVYRAMDVNDYRIQVPTAAKEALHEYMLERDQVQAWFLEHFRVVPPGETIRPWPGQPEWLLLDGEGKPFMITAVAYKQFTEWCKDQGVKTNAVPLNSHFTKRLNEVFHKQGLVLGRKKIAGEVQRVLVNLLPLNWVPVA